MNYLNLLDLEKEPFSNSPDPDFFFASDQHMRSLQRLELTIRLRKGLSVVLGEVGTGKTTLCRRLIRRLDKDGGQVVVRLFLDPEFVSGGDFLRAIADAFGIGGIEDDGSEREIKETIKQHLFSQGVDDDKITVLIIDEGQKLPGFCLEILREFLNFETNNHKLLQIVIFAQLEFRQALAERDNFSDRIAEFCTLTPLNFADTRRLILFRLRQAHGRSAAPKLFNFWALLAVYRQSGGYPRKIVQLCSQSLLSLIIQNKTMVSASLVRACSGRLARQIPRTMPLRPALMVLLLAAILFWQWQANPAAKVRMAQVLDATFYPQQEVVPAGPPLSVVEPENTPQAVHESVVGEEPTVAVAMVDPGQAPAFTGIESGMEPASELNEDLSSTSEGVVPAIEAAVAEESASDKQSPGDENPFSRILADPTLFPENPLLGELKIKQGDSLSRMIKRVYGDFNSELLQKVTAANQHLRDTDLIPVGTVIRFPAASRPYRAVNQPGYRLLLDTETTLVDADLFLKGCFAAAFDVRLAPVWSPQHGLTFMIISVDDYRGEEAAMAVLRKLPTNLASTATVVHGWEDAYLHLANHLQPE